MTLHEHRECPACGAESGADRWCGACGLDLHSADASELRDLAAQLAATDAELNALRARRDALATALLGRKIGANRHPEAAPPAAAKYAGFVPPARAAARPRSSGEWSVERIRNVLLWTGATLLAFSALAFTAVAWTHLSPAGRAALLVAITLISGLAAASLQRRLPATAGAFTGLTIALALIDWQILRRAGAGSSLSGVAWWAIGAAVVGIGAVGLGRVASPGPARRAIVLLLPGSAFLTLITTAHSAASGAFGLALIAAVMVAVDEFASVSRVDLVVRATLRVLASASWIVGVLAALAAAVGPSTLAQALTPALAMLAFAVAPGIASLSPPGRQAGSSGRVAMIGGVVATSIAAALIASSTSIGAVGLLTLAAVLGAVGVVIGPSVAPVWGRAARAVGLIAAVSGLVFAGVESVIAELGPLGWLAHAWTGSARVPALRVVAGPLTSEPAEMGWCSFAILAVAAITVASIAVRRSRAPERRGAELGWAAAIGIALLAVVMAPLVGRSSTVAEYTVVTVAAALVLVGSASATRRSESVMPVAWLALVPIVPAAGWAALTRTTSVVALSVAVVSAVFAAAIGRSVALRAAHAAMGAAAAVALVAVSALAAGASQPVAGFAATVAAGGVLLIGCLARPDTVDGVAVEVMGAAGMIVGALVALPSVAWFAGALTAMIPLLLVSTVRPDRRIGYASAAGAAALAATWAWLATAGVTAVEAYTLPAAALALGAGGWAWKVGRGQSWLNLGPALVLALAPTLLLAIARNDDGRAVAVAGAALAILLAGAWLQLQAPLVLGVVALLALAVDRLGPQAVRLPRWAVLAVAGALLLWVGTTFERRRDDVQRAARRLVELG